MKKYINYWQNFYKKKNLQKIISYPSQFAIFSLNEKKNEDKIVELGCGNGRDAYFFSKYFKKVYALDSSLNAIKLNKKNYKYQKNLFFIQHDINNKFEKKILNLKNKIIYARFFLHTLKNEEIKKLIENCSEILNKDEKVLVEYRNNKDKNIKKIFNKHYRNYLNSKKIIEEFKKFGLINIYSIEGKGYAKFKNEDANVTRQIYIKK